MPNAILPAGTYLVEGDIIKLTINLVKDETIIKTISLEGNKNNLSEFAKKIVEQISIETSK